MYPQIKDSIPDQDKNTLLPQRDQCLPSQITPFSSGFKSLRKEANDDDPDNTDTSRTDKYDKSRTNRYDSIENVKATKKKTMTNTNRIIRNIKKLMKLLLKKPNKTKHLLNG